LETILASILCRGCTQTANERRHYDLARQTQIWTPATHARKLHERLVEGRPKYRPVTNRRAAHPLGSQDDRRTTPQQRRPKEKLRVRQIEARKILRVVDLNPAVSFSAEEQLHMIVEADIETQRNHRDVHVPRIAVIITIGDH